MGVGTGSATVTMHLKVPAGIELGAGAASQFLDSGKPVQVQMRRLDDFLDERGVAHVDFIKADVEAGRSVLVLEPRGDLVEEVLAGMPAERREDVVIIEPGASDKVVGFNPLSGRLASVFR